MGRGQGGKKVGPAGAAAQPALLRNQVRTPQHLPRQPSWRGLSISSRLVTSCIIPRPCRNVSTPRRLRTGAGRELRKARSARNRRRGQVEGAARSTPHLLLDSLTSTPFSPVRTHTNNTTCHRLSGPPTLPRPDTSGCCLTPDLRRLSRVSEISGVINLRERA